MENRFRQQPVSKLKETIGSVRSVFQTIQYLFTRNPVSGLFFMETSEPTYPGSDREPDWMEKQVLALFPARLVLAPPGFCGAGAPRNSNWQPTPPVSDSPGLTFPVSVAWSPWPQVQFRFRKRPPRSLL